MRSKPPRRWNNTSHDPEAAPRPARGRFTFWARLLSHLLPPPRRESQQPHADRQRTGACAPDSASLTFRRCRLGPCSRPTPSRPQSTTSRRPDGERRPPGRALITARFRKRCSRRLVRDPIADRRFRLIDTQRAGSSMRRRASTSHARAPSIATRRHPASAARARIGRGYSHLDAEPRPRRRAASSEQ